MKLTLTQFQLRIMCSNAAAAKMMPPPWCKILNVLWGRFTWNSPTMIWFKKSRARIGLRIFSAECDFIGPLFLRALDLCEAPLLMIQWSSHICKFDNTLIFRIVQKCFVRVLTNETFENARRAHSAQLAAGIFNTVQGIVKDFHGISSGQGLLPIVRNI